MIGDSAWPPLIAEHDTWIDVEPIVGCPAACSYCFLRPLNLQGKRPEIRITPEGLLKALDIYLEETQRRHTSGPFRPKHTPVAIGNYTDLMMTPDGEDFLLAFARGFAEKFSSRRLCVITKARLRPQFIRELETIGLPILFYLSQSFARLTDKSLEKGPVSSPATTLANARLLRMTRNLTPIHFWRPFLSAYNGPATLMARVDDLQQAGFACSVVIGLKVGSGVTVRPMIASLGENEKLSDSGDELMSTDLWHDLRAVAASRGYVVYRNTSCSVALATETPEALGTFSGHSRKARCQETTCIDDQRRRCKSDVRSVNLDEADAVGDLLKRLGVASRWDWSNTHDGVPILTIHGSVSEYAYNIISHRLEVRVRAQAVIQEKAWLGAFTGRVPNV